MSSMDDRALEESLRRTLLFRVVHAQLKALKDGDFRAPSLRLMWRGSGDALCVEDLEVHGKASIGDLKKCISAALQGSL